MSESLITPARLLSVFADGGHCVVSDLQEEDFQPETPDPEVWVGRALGLDPARSTRGWIGRSDTVARRWPVMVAQSVQAGLLTEVVQEDWDIWSTDSALSRIVEQFLHQRPEAPVLVFAHNICWRDTAYSLVHGPTRRILERGHHERVHHGETIVMRFGAGRQAAGIVVQPSLMRWRSPTGINARRMGFAWRRVLMTHRLLDGTVGVAYRERLAVGMPRTEECRAYHAAGLPIACAGLAFRRGPYGLLVPFDPHHSRTGTAEILDVQLIKFWRLSAPSVHAGPFDVNREELVLAFDRRSGKLVYLSTSGAPLTPTAGVDERHDWVRWLQRKTGGLDRAASSL